MQKSALESLERRKAALKAAAALKRKLLEDARKEDERFEVRVGDIREGVELAANLSLILV